MRNNIPAERPYRAADTDTSDWSSRLGGAANILTVSYNIWATLGFTSNPYDQGQLPQSPIGSQLLAGREADVARIQRLIGSRGSHALVDGPVGAGKTSLINVATYRMYETSLAEQQSMLWVPAVRSFQLDRGVEQFEVDFYQVVLQTLIRYSSQIDLARVATVNLTAFDRWINAPEYKNASFGGGLGFVSLQGGAAAQPNTSAGFADSGLPEFVRQQLENIFAGGERGGIICVLDNIEILRDSAIARDELDALRDRLFNIAEIRWVLSGARGILSRARTARLSGIFMAPIGVSPLEDADVSAAIDRRLKAFDGGAAKVPITPEAFEFIYTVLNRNLRDAMSWSQTFSHWVVGEWPALDFPTGTSMRRILEQWLNDRAQEAYAQLVDVQPRTWSYFSDLCDSGGRCDATEYRVYRFGSKKNMVRAMDQLVDANLAVREVDPDNPDRVFHSITAMGYLLDFFRTALLIPAGRRNDALN